MNKILKNGMVVLLSAYFLAGNYMPNKVSEQKVNNRQVKSVGMYNFLQNRDLHLINGLDETINEVMNKLVKDKSLRMKMGQSAYELALAKYDWLKMAREYHEIYGDVLAKSALK